jgi:uncharacterized protein with HEPN domain
MENKQKKYLLDILEATEHIAMFIENLITLEDYEANLLIKRGVERELEIIGEAMSRLLQIENNFPISNARRIVDLRNKVIHGYDKVDDEVIWGVIEKYLPILKTEIAELLNPTELK